MRRIALFLFSLCLAIPTMAADPAKAERQEKFGDTTVHYSTFASTFLQPDIAKAAELVRSNNQGVLNIAVLKEGKPRTAAVSGSVKDLTGRSQDLKFKQVTEQGAVYYLAQYKVDQQETYTFTVNVQADGKSNSFSFNQEVFPGE